MKWLDKLINRNKEKSLMGELNGYIVKYQNQQVKDFVIDNKENYENLLTNLPKLPINLYFYESPDGEYGYKKPNSSGEFPKTTNILDAWLETNIKDPSELIHEHGHAFDYSHNPRLSEITEFIYLKKTYVDNIYQKSAELSNQTQSSIEVDYIKRDVIYSTMDDELFARIYKEYILDTYGYDFNVFDTSWYDDVIHETYQNTKEKTNKFVKEHIENYEFTTELNMITNNTIDMENR